MSTKDHPNNAPGVPMVFPPWFENFQVKYLNPALKPIARYLPGTATIEHRGRKSGKPYKTIVTPYRKGNTLAIALGHGKTDWVKNVLAAGQADVHYARRQVHITNPRILPAGSDGGVGCRCLARVQLRSHGGFRRRRRSGPSVRAHRRTRPIRRALGACHALVKTVLPVIVGQADGASSHATTRSTAGERSNPSASNSSTCGMTARALTRPVTNRTPRVYIESNGISTVGLEVDPGIGTHAVRPGRAQRRRKQRRIGGGVDGDGIRVPGLVGLGAVVDHRPELLGGRQPLRVGVDVVDVGSQRCREGGRIQPDRQPPDHEDAAIDRIEAGQLAA